VKTIEQNVNKRKTVKLPVFSLTRSASYYIILTMEKAMPDAYWILTATDGWVGTRTLCSKVFPFHNSFEFILLFLKFSPIPKFIPHQVEPRPGENKNFINIMDVELEISSRFSILFEICIVHKKQIMHNVISPKIIRTRSIQRRYTHARPGDWRKTCSTVTFVWSFIFYT
jgi:hypothetical protein